LERDSVTVREDAALPQSRSTLGLQAASAAEDRPNMISKENASRADVMLHPL
jgi:hypothetical protein